MIKIHKQGFTIIELMIVLAIVAILVALAVPSFQDTIRKSRRSDAMNAILDIHLAQERWRANDVDYATLTELRSTESLTSPDGYYSLTVTRPDNPKTNYTIVAAPSGDQANDPCGSFTLAFTAGVITKTAKDGSDAELNARCWKR